MCACDKITESSARASTPRFRFCSIDSRRRPWNIPQSRRTFACFVLMRCFEPVTVCAAPTKSICMRLRYRGSSRVGEELLEQLGERLDARGIVALEGVTVREQDRTGSALHVEEERGRRAGILSLVAVDATTSDRSNLPAEGLLRCDGRIVHAVHLAD